jgi:polyphenol oxidase
MWQLEESPLGRIAIPPFIPEGFAVFCTTRDFEGRITSRIAERITAAVRERFDLETTLNTCTQVHGATVRRAQRGPSWQECDSCDGLWSDEKNVSLGIKVADCLPVTMIDPLHSVVANIHSGWRGAVQQITSAGLDAVSSATPFDGRRALAYLGPSIRVCCFEVGNEVAEQFDAGYVDWTGSRPHVDIVAFTKSVLLARGFTEERIFDSGLCTRCEGSVFHSFRRDGKGSGRNLAIVAQ